MHETLAHLVVWLKGPSVELHGYLEHNMASVYLLCGHRGPITGDGKCSRDRGKPPAGRTDKTPSADCPRNHH